MQLKGLKEIMEDKRLYSPSYVKRILKQHGFRFSKSLGQNFLIDGNIVRSIVEKAEVGEEDYVLEIGPGIGTLTEELALRAKKVVAVEIDKKLIPILEQSIGKYKNVEIINEDILEVDLERLIEEKFQGKSVKVVANLPYYVTTPIVARLIEENLNIESIVVMVQKEVAERMAAPPGSKTYGSLSVLIDYFTKPEIVLSVPRTVFMPQPKIASAVIKLDLKKDLEDIDSDKLFKVVRASFSKRRKTVLNALSSYGFHIDKDRVRESLEKAGIDPSERAERLSTEDFIEISKSLPPLNIEREE